MIKIGVIMPVKDQEDFIKKTVESLLSQDIDRTKYEVSLLAIDDGSTDGSMDIVRRLTGDSWVKLEVFKGKGLKPAWARNLALANWRRFDYFAFLDSDDMWLDSHLGTSMSYLEGLNCDLVYSDVNGMFENYEPCVLTGVPNPRYFSLEEIERTNYVYISTVVMRASCARHDRMSRWAEPFPDWEYWHRLCKKYHVHHINRVGANYMWKRKEGPWTYYGQDDAAECNARIVEWREFNWTARVDGWMAQVELDTLREEARGKTVLELGAYKGKSTCAMALDALSVDSIDTFECSMDGQSQTGSITTLDAFVTNTSRFGNVRPLVGKTLEIIPTLKDGTYDFVFIDAMHDYRSVLEDLTAVAPKVKAGGRVALHDYENPDYPGVKRAVWDWLMAQGVDPKQWVSTRGETHGSILVMDVPLGSCGFDPDNVLDPAIETVQQHKRFEEGTPMAERYDEIIKETMDPGGKVLLAPFAVRLPDGSVNPKSPPTSFWRPIVKHIQSLGYTVVHVSGYPEPSVGADESVVRPEIEDLERMLKNCAFFVSVDTFLQHLGNMVGKRGVVVWSQSDPAIFGYPENINVFKDRKYFRKLQFQTWAQTPYMEEAFPSPGDVKKAVDAMSAEASGYVKPAPKLFWNSHSA